MPVAKPIHLGQVVGVRLSAAPSAFAGSALLWQGLSALGTLLLQQPLGAAILLGLAAVLLHWLADLWHQGGHAWAAHRAGHPMVGVQLWGILSTSVYPPGEPALPKAIHIRRVLGGPIGSLLLTVVAIIPLLLLASGTGLWWLALFFFLDNLLTFSAGAFLPLGFTDGSTLLRLARTQE